MNESNNIDLIDDYFQTLDAAKTNHDVKKSLTSLIVDHWGFENYFYMAMLPTTESWLTQPSGLLLTNYPIDFIAHCFSNTHHPKSWSVDYCRTHNTPAFFDYHKDVLHKFPSEYLARIKFLKKYASITGGIAIPVPAIPCRGAFVLTTTKPLKEVSEGLTQAKIVGPSLGLHLHDKLLGMSDYKEISLSNREKVIMEHTADGLSAKEIGILLDINKKTVEHHIYTVKKRLKTPNRAKTLLVCYAYGLIHPLCHWSTQAIMNNMGYKKRFFKTLKESEQAGTLSNEDLHELIDRE